MSDKQPKKPRAKKAPPVIAEGAGPAEIVFSPPGDPGDPGVFPKLHVDLIIIDGTGTPLVRHPYEDDGAIANCDLRAVPVTGDDGKTYYESPVCAHGKMAVSADHPLVPLK